MSSFEKNLYFDTGTIPEIKKNGRFYKFIWEEPTGIYSGITEYATVNKKIYLPKSFISPNAGKKLEPYAFIRPNIGSPTTFMDVYTVADHIVLDAEDHEAEATTFGKGAIVHVSAPIGADVGVLEWGGASGVIRSISDVSRYVDLTTPSDFSSNGTYGSITNGAPAIGNIYNSDIVIPHNFHLVGAGYGSFAINALGARAATQTAFVKLGLPLYEWIEKDNGDSISPVYLGTSEINFNVSPYMDITFQVQCGTNVGMEAMLRTNSQFSPQPQNESLVNGVFWAEFYMGDV